MKSMILLVIMCGCFVPAFSQIDTVFLGKLKSLDTANTIQKDTLAPPEDSFTRKIRKLRSNKHGMSIETVLLIKLKEEQEKDTTRPKAFYEELQRDMTTGKTSKLLENSLINLYRSNFTEKDIDELIRFYNTPAGKKMDTSFILLLVQSVKDAEHLMKLAAGRIQQQMSSAK